MPFPTLVDLSDSGIKPISPASPVSPALAGEFFITSTTWETHRDSRLLQTKSRMGSGMGLLHACDLSLVIGHSVIYFGHLMQRTDSFGKDPEAGKD